MSNAHWFIKEEAISGEDQDAFAHRDIAVQLKFKIEELGAPLTVALSGRHGIGKSSVGSLLSEQFNSDARFVFVRIEAWRHAGEQRRKAFLLDVAEELGKKPIGNEACKKLKEIEHRLSTTQAKQTAVFDIPGSVDALRSLMNQLKHPVLLSAALAFFTTLLLICLYSLLFSGTPIAASWVALRQTLPSILSLPVVVACLAAFYKIGGSISTTILEPPKLTITTSPPSSGEQYERVFREILTNVLNNKNPASNGKSLVIFVDELDRLPPEEIIEALDAIRTFRDVDPCIFIVALDEEVVRLAIEKASSSGALISDAEKAQEFLNKFFKIRQHIPPLVLGDMRDFANRLIRDKQYRKVTEGIAKLSEEQVEDILDALIHRRVKTPRHAIRLINAFNSDYRLGQVRETGQNHTLSPGAITQHLPFLGVMTALREDFPDFHETTIKNPDLINAMDDLLSGKSPRDVEDRFPGYVDLCTPYFAKVGTTNNELGEVSSAATDERAIYQNWGVDFGVPADDNSRILILLLTETALFRAPNIRPFVHFREDSAEREVGGEFTERLRQEFETNAASLLRRNLADGSQSHAKAAAQVALSCLEGSSGSRKQNTIRAVCEVFDLFPDADKERIANRVTAFFAKKAELDLPAAVVFPVISKSVATSDKDYVVDEVIARLLKQDEEDSTQDLHAILSYNELVTTDEQRHLIASFTSNLPKVLSAEELQPWLKAINEHSKSETIIFGFFGLHFLSSVVESAVKIEAKDFPVGYVDDFTAVIHIMDKKLAADDAESYYQVITDLFGARIWSLADLSLTQLQHHTTDLTFTSAKAAVSTLFTSFSENWPSNDATGVQRQLRLHSFTQEVFRLHGQGVFEDDEIMSGLNRYFGYALASDQQQVNNSAVVMFKDFIANFKNGAFDPTIDLIMSLVREKMPNQQAHSAQSLLVLVADYVQPAKMKTHFDAITISLRQAATDEKAEFGMEALSVALTSPVGSVLQVVAVAEATSLISLIQANIYQPPVLTNAGRILDEAFSYLGPNLDAYVNALYSYFGATTTSSNLCFVLDHLQPIAQKELVSDSFKSNFVMTILARWQYISDIAPKIIAASLLIEWRPFLPDAQISNYLVQQLSFLSEEPKMGWKGLKGLWNVLSLDQRLQILEVGRQNASLWEQIIQDVSRPDTVLTSGEVATLLVGFSGNGTELQLLQLEEALSQSLPQIIRDDAADQVFLALASRSDHLEHQPLINAANRLAQAIVPSGLAYYIKLLRNDQSERAVALAWLPEFLGRKLLQADELKALAEALAAALEVDRGELFKLNLIISRTNGIIQSSVYEAKLYEMDKFLRLNPTNDDKAALKLLKTYLPKKQRKQNRD